MTRTAAKYVRLTPSAQPPVRGTAKSAGLDVCADLLTAEGRPRTLYDGRTRHSLDTGNPDGKPRFLLQPGRRILIPSGLAFSTSTDVYTRVAPRSGLALMQGLSILGGVVDADYTGEVGIICHNADPEIAIEIVHGMRIAQLVLEHVSLENPTELHTLEQTDRLGGFGSTGV
jgi:dUTP pyrophosphatase